MKRVLIIGATSGIGKELALLYAQTDAIIGLVGRRESKLKELCDHHPDKYRYRVCDISDVERCMTCLSELATEMGGVDIVIISAGAGELNPTLSYKLEEPALFTNVLGFTCVTDWAYRYFEHQKYGHLVSISSIGGLRGDCVAPAYNASKAYQMNYLEGIHKKSAKSKLPIYVTDVRPGFVDTDMAKGEGLFWVAPVEKASKQIYSAIENKRRIVYVTKRWRCIAAVLKILPFCLYKKL